LKKIFIFQFNPIDSELDYEDNNVNIFITLEDNGIVVKTIKK